MKAVSYTFFFVLTLLLISCDNSGPDTTLYDVSVSVSPEGAGTISPAADSSYEAKSMVVLLAKASEDYHFIGWSGDLERTVNPLPVTVDQDYALKANFIRSEELFSLHENGVTI